MASSEPVPLDKQLACVKREIALRKRVYPSWVTAKRMTSFKAEDEIAAMEAVAQTLERLSKK